MRIIYMIFLSFCITLFCTCTNDTSTPGKDKNPSLEDKLITDSPKGKSELLTEKEFEILQSDIAKKQEEAKGKKPSAAQIETGNKICACMTALDIFRKTIPARSQKEFNKLAKNATIAEVEEIQNCHTQFMKAAIRPIKEKTDRAIYGFKSREHIAEKCLGGHAPYWFYLGKFISDKKVQK